MAIATTWRRTVAVAIRCVAGSAITQLEAALAITLFVRQHAQGLSLTPGGHRVLEQARVVLGNAREISNIAADIAGTALRWFDLFRRPTGYLAK